LKKILLYLFFPVILFAGFPKEYYEIKNTKEMKSYFFSQILHMAKAENAKVLQERHFIKNIFPHLVAIGPNAPEYKLFEKIRKKYKLKEGASKEEFLEVIDVIPYSLVLAQAAIESGWGKSRFFKEANNIFGQWTWSGKGLTPANRDAGKKHKIKIFDSLQDAVRGYILNMNLGWGYKDFRKLRAEFRKKNMNPSGIALSPTLINYSQKKEEYTTLLRKFIVQNNLMRHDF
jgi:Bax protein